MVYLISYDPGRPETNYSELHEAIKQLGDWTKPLETTWLVNVELKAEEIYSRIRPCMDRSEMLLVIQIGPDGYGFVPPHTMAWLQNKPTA